MPRVYRTPETRADCPPPSSPCPHVGCRFNTYLDVGADGTLTILDRVPPSDPRRGSGCALWEEDTETGLAERWGTSRRAIRELEDAALSKLRAALNEGHYAALLRLVEARRQQEETHEDADTED
jgi:hypothetical protein